MYIFYKQGKQSFDELSKNTWCDVIGTRTHTGRDTHGGILHGVEYRLFLQGRCPAWSTAPHRQRLPIRW